MIVHLLSKNVIPYCSYLILKKIVQPVDACVICTYVIELMKRTKQQRRHVAFSLCDLELMKRPNNKQDMLPFPSVT